MVLWPARISAKARACWRPPKGFAATRPDVGNGSRRSEAEVCCVRGRRESRVDPEVTRPETIESVYGVPVGQQVAQIIVDAEENVIYKARRALF
jgi:hypothetical protein